MNERSTQFCINTMASNLLFLSSILLAFALTTHGVSVSDITLICSKTFDQDFCTKTLKDDPTWTTANLTGLGRTVIKQATDRAKYVPQYLGSITARAEPELAAKYQACSLDYQAVIAELDEAGARFGRGEAEAAFQSVKTAFDRIGKSLNRFKQPPTDLSQFTPFSRDIQTLSQAFLSQAFLTVVNMASQA